MTTENVRSGRHCEHGDNSTRQEFVGQEERTNEPPDIDSPRRPYRVSVSLRFLVLSSASSVLFAFIIGCAARIRLLRTHRHKYRIHDRESPKGLPYPEILEGREVPHTSYTSKQFDTAASASSSSVLVRSASKDEWKTCAQNECAAQAEDEMDEEEHLPAGQHLLVDMKGVDTAFLDSEERLAKGILETIKATGLTLLSYHCHTLVPSGVSCVGVLLESHISFHTWPQEGVITLDLFTCGSSPLVPVIPILQGIFGVPPAPTGGGPVEHPTILWSHKLRGFRPDQKDPLQAFDLGQSILGQMDMDMKTEILSRETEYQRLDVYDIILPHSIRTMADFDKSISGDGSYQSRNPDLYAPNRVVMLDGILQSSRIGDASYHEALVHPAMFAHDSPKRVGIIGGGEGATLREVLKHATVQKAIMVEIDKEMVELSRKYLSDWNDCSDLVGSADCCIDDARTNMYYEDAIAWFIDRFHATDEKEANAEHLENGELLDIIIMDALDPEYEVAFAEALYNNGVFLEALYASLSSNGVLVMQLGASPRTGDPAEAASKFKTRAALTKHLEEMGYESILVYEEAHQGFGAPWSYLLAFKSYGTRMNWYTNEAELELAIQTRTVPTKSGQSSLRYFDGATMASYQQPHKSFEAVFCKQEPIPQECHELRGFHMNRPNAPISSFEVKTSGRGEDSGQGVFTNVPLKKGTYLAIEKAHQSLHFFPYTHNLVMQFIKHKHARAIQVFKQYIHGYGFRSQERGGIESCVSSGILAFANHGCRGTYNAVKYVPGLTEATSDPDIMPEEMSGRGNTRLKVYNPVVARHIDQRQASSFTFSRDVNAGEEVLYNYLEFVGHRDDWKSKVMSLHAQCRVEKD